MLKFFCLLALLLCLAACGRVVHGFDKKDQSKIELAQLNPETMSRLRGQFHGACSEWNGSGYRAYGVVDYTFQSESEYSLNAFFYLDSECQILSSQLESSGTLNHDRGLATLHFSHQWAQFRVFGDALAVQSNVEDFCHSHGWVESEWKDIHSKCGLGIGLVQSVHLNQSSDEMDLYLCADPNARNQVCPVQKLERVSAKLRKVSQ